MSASTLHDETYTPSVFTCPECGSVHFNLRWAREAPDTAKHLWNVCCEGCGTVYDLNPNGTAEPHSK